MCLRCEAREREEEEKIWRSWVVRRGVREVRVSEGGGGRAERAEGIAERLEEGLGRKARREGEVGRRGRALLIEEDHRLACEGEDTGKIERGR